MIKYRVKKMLDRTGNRIEEEYFIASSIAYGSWMSSMRVSAQEIERVTLVPVNSITKYM